jgi:2-methylcitrate dehydratase PrpD
MAENGFTRKLAAFVVNTSEIPSWAFDHAKVAFMDWVAVTFGGKDDPLVIKLMDFCTQMGGAKQATIIGHGVKMDVMQAALINGSASHALDYDDTLVSFLGHPSVTLFPALLALAEWKGRSGKDFLDAYLIGLQAGGAVGACASLDHYMAGWHATSTLGHLAAAAGCSRLLGLDEQQTVYALGIGGTQSSGLKRVFGTMCKPFHAGRAAQSGLMAAMLARKGFTSAEDILEGPQGFFECLKGKANDDIAGMLGMTWDVINLSQKYHASCHATHSPLEAAMNLVNDERLALSEIKSICIHSSQLALDAAGKREPASGLEGKFSISYCVANALLRSQTGTQAFSDEMVRDPEIRRLMEKITVVHDPEMKALEAVVEIETMDGRTFRGFSDILQQNPPYEIKRERVQNKFQDLCEPIMGQGRTKKLGKIIATLDQVTDMRRFSAILRQA